MSAERLFLAEGANFFGNRLIYKNQDVGVKMSGALTLNAFGESEYARLSDITDVVAKPKPAAPKAARAKKADPVEVVEDEPVEQSLDDLLGD